MAAPSTVFDDMDDETAQLVIKWQLEDIARLTARQGTPGGAEDEAARQVYENELKAYRSLRGFPADEVSIPENGGDEPQEQHQAPADSPQFECSCCGELNVSEHDYAAPCDHHYCTGCLTDLFSTAMRDERYYPPRCCKQNIPFEDARVFLEYAIESEFAGKKEELDDTRRTYCHVPTCSTYVPQSHKNGDKARCPTCNELTCIICHGAGHEGDCPQDEAVQSTLEEARKEGWQQCFKCKRMVELTIGCNHITCLCKAEFCYVCGGTWKPKTCPCPQFHEHRLLARAQQVADREGGDVAQVAEELREHHECEDGEHDFEQEYGAADCDECGDYLHVFIWRCSRCHTDMCSRCRFNN